MADKILTLTDAHRRQMEAALKRLGALKRELAALQAAGVMDCTDYSELCDFVSGSLSVKLNHFFPNAGAKRARKGGDE